MKKFLRRFVVAPIVLLPAILMLSSCATIQELLEKPSPKTPELLAQGKKLYENNCVQCHGPNGDGKGWKAAELKKKPRDFTLPFDQWNYGITVKENPRESLRH
jgi:mono/diheme cytochrome c family protein